MAKSKDSVNHVSSKFFIQVSGDLGEMTKAEKSQISSDLDSFTRSYDGRINEGHLELNLIINHQKTRSKLQFTCKANFTTDKGRFNTVDKGWGASNAAKKALRSIAKQAEKKIGRSNKRVPTRIKE